MDFLKRMLENKTGKIAELRNAIKQSEDIEAVKRYGAEIEALEQEIADIRNEITAREAEPTFNPTMTVATSEPSNEPQRSENVLESMEYREAFRDYVTKGVKNSILQQRSSSGTATDLGDLGVVIPLTVVNEIMTQLEKVYGSIYSKVKKTNLRGGVKYPIGTFSDATFYRITDGGEVSSYQHTGEVTGSIDFTYNIGEIRIERTLLERILTVPEFESKFAEVVVRSYVRAMEYEIIAGVPIDSDSQATGQMQGILTSDRVTQEISFTDEDMADWKKWREKFFGEIPLAMRGMSPEFMVTPNTFEANMMTLSDDNNRPIGQETFNPVNGAEVCKFYGKTVQLIEENLGSATAKIKNFNDCSDGDVWGIYWIPEKAYVINSNLEFSVVDWFDHETNKYKKKAIVINDGKPLDTQYIWLLTYDAGE